MTVLSTGTGIYAWAGIHLIAGEIMAIGISPPTESQSSISARLTGTFIAGTAITPCTGMTAWVNIKMIAS